MAPSRVLGTSQVCTYGSIPCTPAVALVETGCAQHRDPNGNGHPAAILHRRMREWSFLCESLREAGMLQPGRRGLGFGAREPLVSLFAGVGCDLVVAEFRISSSRGEATSPDADGELAGAPAAAIDHRFCPADLFRERVQYLELDLQDVLRRRA